MRFTIISIIYLLFLYCNTAISQTLATTHLTSEANKKSIDKVLEHYKDLGDKEKYEAALFLVKNMSSHRSVSFNWIDETGGNICFNETDYDDIESAKEAFNQIKNANKLTATKNIEYDAKFIDHDYLINNIDLAFKVWRENEWSRGYDFKTFCEYILPYRSLIEPMQDWRNEYNILYSRLIGGISDKSDPVEVCSRIIKSVEHFDFVLDRYDPTPLLGPLQLLFWREGNCPDLANVCIFAGRSLGVAVTFDFTPFFAASSNKHFWNTVIDKYGEHIPFNGNQVLPYVYNANYRRMGKVFRNTYSIQKNTLPFSLDEKDIPEEFLKSKNIIDVTREYVDVSTIDYSFSRYTPSEIGYLSVFNQGDWKIVDWSKLQGGKESNFKDIGRDIVYLPIIYENQKKYFEPYPILLGKKGMQTILRPHFDKVFTATLTRENEEENKYEDNNPFDLENNKSYTLYVWNKRWQPIDKKEAKNNQITFSNVPENGLFIMAPEKPDFFERIFVIDRGTNKITWY